MGNVTGYSYTDNGLVSAISIGDPTQTTWFSTDWYSYDGAGNMTEHWTNNGATYTTYTVDAADRVTQQVQTPPASTAPPASPTPPTTSRPA